MEWNGRGSATHRCRRIHIEAKDTFGMREIRNAVMHARDRILLIVMRLFRSSTLRSGGNRSCWLGRKTKLFGGQIVSESSESTATLQKPKRGTNNEIKLLPMV